MAKQFNVYLPSVQGIVKTAIALVIIMFVVRMTPTTWGIKKWFLAA